MTTDKAIAWNRYLDGPVSSTTGKNTIQIARVAMSAGTAICCAPSSMAMVRGLPSARFRCMFSTSTVASSTSIPIASDRPPSVIMFSELPVSFRKMIPTNIDSGIDVQTITMLRQLPRKNMIIRDTSIAPITASCNTLSIEFSTKTD